MQPWGCRLLSDWRFVLMTVTLLFQNGQPLLAQGRCSGHSGSVNKMVLGLKGHTSQGGSWEACAVFYCITVQWAGQSEQNKGFSLCRRTGCLREGEGRGFVRVLTTVWILKEEWEFPRKIKRWQASQASMAVSKKAQRWEMTLLRSGHGSLCCAQCNECPRQFVGLSGEKYKDLYSYCLLSKGYNRNEDLH